MYTNKICPENDKDIEGAREKKLDIFFEHEKKYKQKRLSEDIAHFIMLWFKYYRGDNTDYYSLANSSLGEIKYTNNEWNNIIENSKIVLKNKYNINIVSCKPLVLSSNFPFNNIKEKYY